MPSSEPIALRALVPASAPQSGAALLGAGAAAAYRDIASGAVLAGRRAELGGKCVLIDATTQFASALAMLELDGVASRMVICPPDFTPERLASAIAQAEVDAIVCDDETKDFGADKPAYVLSPLARDAEPGIGVVATEWVLPTSGTTGAPKLVAHSLKGLLGVVQSHDDAGPPPVWATFYDIRRYGGMQIFLRAVTTGATLVVAEADEPLADHVARMAAAGVTHISGTPSHWRRLLMSPDKTRVAPIYVRVSGEIADRAILDALKAAYPHARIVHAYASTEAGVAFEVTDGREGFPASYLGGVGATEMRVVDGSLRIRSPRTARRYVGRDDRLLFDAEGFVDTDDMVALCGDRYLFKGRRAGVINVGGLKVHPEEVEQVINLHGSVSMSLVKARRSPITGDLIVADVVLKDTEGDASPERRQALRDEILATCRARLDRYKAPVAISFVPSLDVQASGKIARRYA